MKEYAIFVNGERRVYPNPLRIEQLLEELGTTLVPGMLFVRNDEVVEPQDYHSMLEHGDRVEIVQLVGGG